MKPRKGSVPGITLTQEAVLANASYAVTSCCDCGSLVSGDPAGARHCKFLKHHRKHRLHVRVVKMKETKNSAGIFAA